MNIINTLEASVSDTDSRSLVKTRTFLKTILVRWFHSSPLIPLNILVSDLFLSRRDLNTLHKAGDNIFNSELTTPIMN